MFQGLLNLPSHQSLSPSQRTVRRHLSPCLTQTILCSLYPGPGDHLAITVTLDDLEIAALRVNLARTAFQGVPVSRVHPQTCHSGFTSCRSKDH